MKSQNKVKTALLLATLVLLTVLTAVPAYADDTGYIFPTAEVTGTTGNGPSNLGKAFADDVATGAQIDDNCELFKTDNTGGGGGVADSEIYNTFGFSIPSGATIDGIEVIVSGYRTGSPSITDFKFSVRLWEATTSQWTGYKSTPELLRNLDAEYTLGGSGDLWGLLVGDWTDDSFSNTNFQLEVKAAGQPNTGELWKLDSVSVKVYYTITAVFEGLSHGYWKTHTGDWTGYSTDDTLDDIFDLPASIDLGSNTLLQALDFGGGDTLTEKAQILFVQAVAALLNAAHPDIDYPLTVAQVITEVNTALATENPDTIIALKDVLDGYNNLGGDLGS
jgi:hypothetical protein